MQFLFFCNPPKSVTSWVYTAFRQITQKLLTTVNLHWLELIIVIALLLMHIISSCKNSSCLLVASQAEMDSWQELWFVFEMAICKLNYWSEILWFIHRFRTQIRLFSAILGPNSKTFRVFANGSHLGDLEWLTGWFDEFSVHPHLISKSSHLCKRYLKNYVPRMSCLLTGCF